MPVRRPTVRDIAAAVGVSAAAVSYALNDRPGVSEQTRARIREVARELGWVPNWAARALVSQRSSLVGLILQRHPETLAADPFFARLLAGMEQTLSREGVALVLRVVGQDDERDAYQGMVNAGSAGFVLTDLRVDDPRGEWLRELSSSAVALARPDQAAGLPAVELDDRPAVAASVRHLVDLGNERIAHVAGIPGMVHTASRIEAFVTAMTDAGLDPTLVEVGDFTAEGGAAATKRLFSTGRPGPTAIVYANDLMAMAGMSALEQLGLSVPGDVSITGFDDAPLAPHASPPLTSVTCDVLGWGRAAARSLLDVLDGTEVTHVALPPARLVLRGSTGPSPTRPEARTRPDP